ncbi:MAG TPA: Hsp20/alpha crystallin family protein [Candidatus Limnocylindrales bacterium]|nr:Hsp20/alpha crystallin family protein [Candidatus Limnocylindrales bacterium]
MRRNSPFGELLSLRQAMDRLFEDSYIRPGALGEAQHPLPLDVYNEDNAVVIEAALPGVRPDDVEISVLGDTLTISARTSEEKRSEESGYSYREIRRGSFSRSVALPGGLDADRAAAAFENGLLRLSIPKAEAAKPRQIKVNANGDGQSHGSIGQGEQGREHDQSSDGGQS